MIESRRPRLIDRLWFRLLVAAWVLGVVVYYYWLQGTRLLTLTR